MFRTEKNIAGKIESPHREWLRSVLSVHGKLVESLEWSGGQLDHAALTQELPRFVSECCGSLGLQLSSDEQEVMQKAVLSETFGLGPLDSLLEDPYVSDVLVNHYDEIFIERHGRLIRTPVCFADDEHLLRIIHRLAGRVGRRIDESSPMVDARLEDGSRVHAVIHPLALRGPTLSIRRFGRNIMSFDALVQQESMTAQMADFLRMAVQSRIGVLISGGTGAGKTTLLNVVSSAIGREERVVTIEDAAELKLQHPHFVSLETRPESAEGSGRVSIRDLVRTSLRMRPDRIIVGEVRGDEVLDMLQAMNTGHPGSMTTIHANSTRLALSRLEMMIGLSGQQLELPVLRNYIASGIGLVIHVSRMAGGVRRVTQITELAGVKEGVYRLRDLFGFREDGVDSSGKSVGHFFATEHQPSWLKRKRLTQIASRSGAASSPSLQLPKPAAEPRFGILSTVIEQIEDDEQCEDEEGVDQLELSATPDEPTLVVTQRCAPITHASTVSEPTTGKRFSLVSVAVERVVEAEDDDGDERESLTTEPISPVVNAPNHETQTAVRAEAITSPPRSRVNARAANPTAVDFGASAHIVIGATDIDHSFKISAAPARPSNDISTVGNRHDQVFDSVDFNPLHDAVDHVASPHSTRRA